MAKMTHRLARWLDVVFDVYIKNHPQSRVAAKECEAAGIQLGVYADPAAEPEVQPTQNSETVGVEDSKDPDSNSGVQNCNPKQTSRINF